MSSEAIGVVGAGRFGTALANAVAKAGRDVIVWSRNAEVVTEINESRTNARIPGVELAPTLKATSDPAELGSSTRLIVLAVASTDVRSRIVTLGEVLDGSHLLVHALGSLATPGDVRVTEVMHEETAVLRVGALAGPSLFQDLLTGQFSSMVAASRFDEVTSEVRRLIGVPPVLRIYRSKDLVGVELAAALSGAYTVAIGMSDALGVGPGPRAVLVTRAVAEASRLGEAEGAEARTFAGLAGLGNVLVRSSSDQSRDYQLGKALGAGDKITEDAFTEGARAALAGVRLADRHGIRMPVLSACAAVIKGELTPREAAGVAGDTVAGWE
jgi:glycerol-3-phosphate dehydrogenase (NAD(P)+)